MTGDIGNSATEEASKLMDEAKKMETKKRASEYLEAYFAINNRDDKNSFILKAKEFSELNDEESLRSLLNENKKIIQIILNLYNFLSENKSSFERCRHDLGGIVQNVNGPLQLSFEAVKNDKDVDIDMDFNIDIFKIFLNTWDRYFIAVEDILIRLISNNEVPDEFQKGVDIDVLVGSNNYFETKELNKIKAFSTSDDSVYKKINDIKISLVTDSDWERIKTELAGRKIAGANGLIGNFELNALRNAIKDRVEAKEVVQTIEIKDDRLIIRIVDNGKGIRPKFLQKGYKEKDEITGEEKEIYIFHEGASGTGSTGKGLADFDTRLASVGGELYVSTKTVNDGMVRFQYGSTAEKANEVEFDESLEHGTVFEIRLPITQKQK